MSARVLIATGNAHKVGEIRAILSDLGIEWLDTRSQPHDPDVEEVGGSYRENALIKAAAWAKASGLPALADDSGLEVDCLYGRPGLYSARYGSEQEAPIPRLLRECDGVAPDKRTARFRCVVCLALPDGPTRFAEGKVEGAIAFEPRGTQGFGFDPVFVPVGFDGKHLAELPDAVKNTISHRANALNALRPALDELILSRKVSHS